MLAAISSLCGLYWFAARWVLWSNLREEIQDLRDENRRLRNIVARQLELYVVMDDRVRLVEDQAIGAAGTKDFRLPRAYPEYKQVDFSLSLPHS